jgi:hypothetical protein
VTLTVASRAFNFGTAAPLAGTAQPVVLPVRADGPASAPEFDVA